MIDRSFSSATRYSIPWVALLLAALPLATPLVAQETSEAYLTPPDGIAEEVLAPRHRNVTLNNESPNGDYFMNTEQAGFPQLRDYARPHHNLAGLQIDPQANRTRWLSTRTTLGLELIDAETGDTRTPDAGRSTPQHVPVVA